MKNVLWTYCAACGRQADIAKGIFLARLYSSEFFCRGCGRRTLHCTCWVSEAMTAKAA